MRRFGLGLILAGLTLAAAPAARAGEPVIFRLNFTPWGMHAQYYAALKQGFYAAEGLDVEIRPAAAGQRNEALIATGREQLGVTNGDSFVKARASGLPVVAVMGDQPDTPFSVFSLKTANITKPQDLKGKKLAFLQANIRGLLDPLLHAGGLTREDIQFVDVPRGTEVQMVAAGQTDAGFGYWYGQPLTLEMRGMPTNVLPLKDYGVKFYGSIVYTSDSFAKSHPQTVEKFLRATLKGLIWTKDHIEEAMSYVVAVAPDRDQALESRKLRMIYDLYAASPDYRERFGTMVDDKWQSSVDILAGGGDLDRKPKPSELYTNAFVEKLPETKQFADLLHAK